MSINTAFLKTTLLSALRHEMPQVTENDLPISDSTRRDMLGDFLIASNVDWKEETLQMIDQIWTAERENSTSVVAWTELDDSDGSVIASNYQGTHLHVWKGDITQLQVDAVVNAANDRGLGCFVPQHRCIDNVIHRAAGPRLRLECREVMTRRPQLLVAGTPPIVTKAYHLPSKYVIHVTGPQIAGSGRSVVKSIDCESLSKCYEGSLDMAVANKIRTVAFPCISTGLFGFPQELAAEIALTTVKRWLDSNPGHLDAVVFDVFSDTDQELYEEKFGEVFPAVHVANVANVSEAERDSRSQGLQLAKRWIEDADAVLICAGAGMSVKEGEMVYTNPKDFSRHYPWFPKWGYNTSYEVMGLGGDNRVPATAKWALYAKHMDNMRWTFTPNDGYGTLMDLVKDKNYFVLTSNVDGCFERSGFPADRIYTPQGEWTYVQCMQPCRPDSVFESRPILDQILPHISEDGFIPQNLVPKCRNCGGPVFGNVRGGSWFLHTKYQEQNTALQQWMADLVGSGTKEDRVVVIEVGAGFNTPTVTRFPVESFVRALGDRGRLIRINPSDPDVPADLTALSVAEGWQVLDDIANAKAVDAVNLDRTEADVVGRQKRERKSSDMRQALLRYFGHFDFQKFLNQLRD